MNSIEYGIASESNPDIENLGVVSRAHAEATVDDSRTVWPDVYLVERAPGNGWHRA